MEGIENISKAKEEALEARILTAIKASDCPQNIKNGLTAYSKAIIHPTTGKRAKPIDKSGYYFQWFSSELTEAELNSIVEFGSEWFPDAL